MSESNLSAKGRRHARNIARSAKRRASYDVTVPSNAMVSISSLPAKARDKWIEELGAEYDAEMLVPDPRRGLTIKGRQADQVLFKRAEQQKKIDAKRTQRRNFAGMDRSTRLLRRTAGQLHKAPGELVYRGGAFVSKTDKSVESEGI